MSAGVHDEWRGLCMVHITRGAAVDILVIEPAGVGRRGRDQKGGDGRSGSDFGLAEHDERWVRSGGLGQEPV